MNILFLHRSFPAQFKYLATELAKDPSNVVMFITNNQTITIEGVVKIPYSIEEKSGGNIHPYLQIYEESVRHGQAVAKIAATLKEKGLTPDIIYGHSWGPNMFMKDIFPDVPLICYFEWYNKIEGSAEDSVFTFNGQTISEDEKAKIKCNNSHVLMDLCNCDAGISPTQWQKEQFPKEFHHKIKVLHDGVDTELCKPDRGAKLFIKEKNITLTASDEVITYATRGMEPYRGFPEFMQAVEILQKKRPKAHFVIAGDDITCYGPKLLQGTFKELVLQQLNIDLSRVHFVGTLPFEEYVNLLQISSVHVYLTYPFILSWSLIDAMSVGCCIVASNTKPVLEVIKDNYNGLIVGFPNVNQLVLRIEYALNNKEKMKVIRINARKTAVENYALKKLLPEHIAFIESFMEKK